MKKLALAFFVLVSLSAPAQTLFTYGKDSVSLNEFLQAYHKNNSKSGNEKALRAYLDLYIASRLKVKEAISLGYDTMPQMQADMENLRAQILPAYLNDKEDMDRLVQEAFTRSQKDIHLAHIFIPAAPDDQQNEKKAQQALAALKRSSFAQVAKEYSADPSAKTNGGDLGYITVFSLPYELENQAYALKPGQVSNIFKSKAGYHIFKNLGERKALGRIKAAQILLAFPPDIDEAGKNILKQRADSLYNRLAKGDDFGKLATQFSNDVISAASNGQMQEFGVGEFTPAFENLAFSLTKDGAVSKPLLTEHGYHIVKRMARLPVSTVKDPATIQSITDKIQSNSDRMAGLKAALAKKVLAKGKYTPAVFSRDELWLFSDSILDRKPVNRPLRINENNVLFQLGNDRFTVLDWISFAQYNRYRSDGSGVKPYPALYEDFIQNSALKYYQSHLEDFSEPFRRQLHEFRDGNLFFEIMQKHVWEPAQQDSVALRQHYAKNMSDYTWKESVDAIVFYVTDPSIAKTVHEQVKQSPGTWRTIVANFGEKVVADSSRFEMDQLPNTGKQVMEAGRVTPMHTNKEDNTTSFSYIVRRHKNPQQKTFAEAKGMIINDYQVELESAWVKELKKKYPVVINEKVLNELLKSKRY
jgi:peptidyl-prolyl cis-trans isomerase SurA